MLPLFFVPLVPKVVDRVNSSDNGCKKNVQHFTMLVHQGGISDATSFPEHQHN
jgi:hypothetical protein